VLRFSSKKATATAFLFQKKQLLQHPSSRKSNYCSIPLPEKAVAAASLFPDGALTRPIFLQKKKLTERLATTGDFL